MPSVGEYLRHKFVHEDHGTVPLGLHPGTKILIKDTPLLLIGDSMVKDVKKSDTITMLGYYVMDDMMVFRAYFEDESSFLEIPIKKDDLEHPLHIRLFRTKDENVFDPGLKEFMLTGNGRDKPAIGMFRFSTDDVAYDRSWAAGTHVPEYVSPVHTTEHLMDQTKQVVQDDIHDLMLYQRNLDETTVEYLIADWVKQTRPDQKPAEVFRVFIGIDLVQSDIEIYPT